MILQQTPWLTANDTLICFGDSITAAPDGYVALLQKMLAKYQINVINKGRSGDKTPWALTRLNEDVINLKPDAVMIFLGTNDSIIGHRRYADEPQVSPRTYEDNLIWMAFLCRQSGIKKVCIVPPAWKFEGETYDEFGNAMEPYCQAARRAAERSQSFFVPLDTAFERRWERNPGHIGLLSTLDGTHMNEKGNELIASTLMKWWDLR